MSDENRIISIAVDPDTEERLKAAAALRDVSIEQICFEIIEEESRNPYLGGGPYILGGKQTAKRNFAQIFAESYALTGGAPLGGPDSSKLIREAREERMREIEQPIEDDGSTDDSY